MILDCTYYQCIQITYGKLREREVRRKSKRALKRTKSLPREVGELISVSQEGERQGGPTEEPVCVDNECVCVRTHMWIYTCLIVNTKFVITSGSQKGFPRFLETPLKGSTYRAG